MSKPITVGETVRIKSTQRTMRAGIADIQAEVVARCGSVNTIEIGEEGSDFYGLYLASDSELERIES